MSRLLFLFNLTSPGEPQLLRHVGRTVLLLSRKKIISIDITDASGRLVKRLTVNAENRYNINDLQRGIHFIKIRG